MSQKEINRGPLAVFSGAAYGGSLVNSSYLTHGRDEKAAPPALPGDLADAPIPGWENAWIDLGGEG